MVSAASWFCEQGDKKAAEHTALSYQDTYHHTSQMYTTTITHNTPLISETRNIWLQNTEPQLVNKYSKSATDIALSTINNTHSHSYTVQSYI